jgi:glucose/arabinose dehydrogenase
MTASSGPLPARRGAAGIAARPAGFTSRGAARVTCLVAACLLWLVAPAAAAVELTPFLAGLSSPLYLTHGRDGSGRLYVVEQPGVVKVLPPGGGSASVFLDITDRVLAGGERGLLGLAFHPQYAANGRLFVNYTRQPDGATVVAEYRRAPDPALASRTETVLLTIEQPFANHNGGMIEFGPDGFLYIGTGDGGSGNDPGDRAQDTESLLGKILRIDVNAAPPYGIPADNPFVAPAPGRDEIYALGLRNPYRFSFDRATGQLLVGDVGQNAREEIDVVDRGANLGWRVLEGSRCTGLGPASCASPGFTPPVAEYGHDGGRCSVTGGYVYRGRLGALPAGTYVFGDFCTGEIFTLAGSTQTRLMETGLNIASFGEDESGELYVVDLGGTVHRLAAVGQAQAQVLAAVLPSSRSVAVGQPATAFATMINAGPVAATGCAVELASPIAAGFAFQTTDPATNLVTGSPNTPVSIPPQGSQSFVFAITPTAPLEPTVVALRFQCANAAAAAVIPGVDTLRLSAAPGPTPDLVALVALRPGENAVSLPGAGGSDVFGVAAVNVGTAGTVAVQPETDTPLPVGLAICQTDAQARCLAAPAGSVTVDVGAGQTPSFAVFATGAGTIPFDPAASRVFVRFRDASGAIRGETSAAIRTF